MRENHREAIIEFLGSLPKFKRENIIDWGCGVRPVIKYIQHDSCKFAMIDKRPDVDANVVHDLMSPEIPTEKKLGFPLATVSFCMEVIEHVSDPSFLISQIAYRTGSGGRLYMSAPFMYEEHSEEDYFRFTKQGITLLLESNGFVIESIEPTTPDLRGWLIKARKRAIV